MVVIRVSARMRRKRRDFSLPKGFVSQNPTRCGGFSHAAIQMRLDGLNRQLTVESGKVRTSFFFRWPQVVVVG
jgi:hypothetical protein